MDLYDNETADETQGENNEWNNEQFDLFNNIGFKSENYSTVVDYVIFLVDCLSDHFAEVLIVVEEFLKSKVISNDGDLFGLVLYNSSKTSNPFDFRNINVLISQVNPSAELILKIRHEYEILKKDILQNKVSSFISDDECSLNDVLYIVQSEFNNQKKSSNKINKRIFLFTSRDNPMSEEETERLKNKYKNQILSQVSKNNKEEKTGSSNIINIEKNINFNEERKKTEQKVKDLSELEIKLELFPLSEKFKMDNFYNKIIFFETEEEKHDFEWYLNNGFIEKLSELCKRIRNKNTKKRTLGKLQFFLTNEFSIDVDVYCLANFATKTKTAQLHSQTNQLLAIINNHVDKETGESLHQNKIATYIPYGDKKIPFTKEDMLKVKALDTPCIRLLGFRSMDKLKVFHQITKSYFLFPNETLSMGSSRVFDAMIKQMQNKNKFALVKFTPREGSKLRMCALLPQIETFDENHFQTPAGFNLIPLPYAEELRSNEDYFNFFNSKFPKGCFTYKLPDVVVSEEIENLKEKAIKSLVKKLTINDFSVRLFEKYYLQKFYSTLEAIALREKEASEITDTMSLSNDEFSSTIIELVQSINQLFGLPDNYDDEGNRNENKKVKKAVSSNNIESKKSKSKYLEAVLYDRDLVYYTDERLKQLKDEGNLSKLKVDLLKSICSKRGLDVKKLKKNDLINILEEDIN